MEVVTDPANQFRFVTKRPTTNWAVRTLDADQDEFYKPMDDARAAQKLPPLSRAGHLWSVYLSDSTE